MPLESNQAVFVCGYQYLNHGWEGPQVRIYTLKFVCVIFTGFSGDGTEPNLMEQAGFYDVVVVLLNILQSNATNLGHPVRIKLIAQFNGQVDELVSHYTHPEAPKVAFYVV